MTAHINADKKDIAPIVIMPGDPRRATFIAENFLDDYKLVTNVRNIFGYTGYFNGVRVTVMASGMGMPSMAIYAYELYNFYGVEKIIRVGSCKSLIEDIRVGDLILGESAYTLSNFAYSYAMDNDHFALSNSSVNDIIESTSLELGIHINKGSLITSDTFYYETENPKEKKHNPIGVEMECFGLFYLSNKLGKESSAILTVSNSDFGDRDLTALEREQSFKDAIVLALSSIVK